MQLRYVYRGQKVIIADLHSIWGWKLRCNVIPNGGFAVQLTSESPFPVDQAVEETVNKDTQTAGGTKGFSLKPSSVQKHYMISEFRTSFLGNLRDMCNTAGQKSIHHDLKPSRIEKDEDSIQTIVDLLEINWTNPFDNKNTELVSLSSGAVPSESICNDLSKEDSTVQKCADWPHVAICKPDEDWWACFSDVCNWATWEKPSLQKIHRPLAILLGPSHGL